MRESKFIVIEGLDGSGKSTQLDLLQTFLKNKSIPFRHIHFPRLGQGVYGSLIADFLRGGFGSIEEVHPKLVALLYAGDRYEFAPVIREWLADRNLVIADRYVYSNIAFQCAKCTDPEEKIALKQWILDLEFEYHNIPMPDLSLLLNVPSQTTVKALAEDAQRIARTYLEGGQDIHESNTDFQTRVHQEYLELAKTEANFHLVQGTDANGERLSPEDTHRAILRNLQEMHVF